MAATPTKIYLEIGKKRTIAGALDWPGWCRVGKNEADALDALLAYAPRYGRILTANNIEFNAPDNTSELVVAEQIEGNATTDFGAPALPPAYDEQSLSASEHERLQAILKAGWRGFDEAVKSAEGKTLQKGPRGGGRELEAIMEHLLESDQSYLSAMGWKYKRDKSADLTQRIEECRTATLEGLNAAVQGDIPEEGPRGGKRWKPRYFVRRTAWHTFDHIWEIEDRVIQ